MKYIKSITNCSDINPYQNKMLLLLPSGHATASFDFCGFKVKATLIASWSTDTGKRLLVTVLICWHVLSHLFANYNFSTDPASESHLIRTEDVCYIFFYFTSKIIPFAFIWCPWNSVWPNLTTNNYIPIWWELNPILVIVVDTIIGMHLSNITFSFPQLFENGACMAVDEIACERALNFAVNSRVER